MVLQSLTEYLQRLGMKDSDVSIYASKLRESNYSSVPTLAKATPEKDGRQASLALVESAASTHVSRCY